MATATVSDEDLRFLVLAAQQEDSQAFELLVSALERKVYALARSLVGNDSDAQDVVQDIFIKLYLNINRFHWESSFTTWFYRLAKNTAIDFIRHRKRHETHSLDAMYPTEEGEMQQEIADTAPLPAEEQEKQELADLVARSMQALPEDQRTILVLRDMLDTSYEEIAKQLDCPLGTVKSRIFRARAALRERILTEEEQYHAYLRQKSKRY